MKTALLFLAKFFLFSCLLYVFHEPLMMAYEFMLLLVISFFPSSHSMAPGAYYDSSFRLIPFLALLLAVPRIAWKRRLAFLGLGVALFWGLDLVSFLMWVSPPSRSPGVMASRSHILYSLAWELLGHWVLPFLLLLVAVHKELKDWLSLKAE